MFVSSYAPPPIEIPDNVAEEKYATRLAFVRRVLNGYAGSIAVSVGVSRIPIEIPMSSACASVLGILLGMSLVRRLAKGRRMEVVVSAGMLLPLLFAIGMLLRSLDSIGWPIWALPLCVAFVWLYGTLCGRDLSFIAMFALPSVAILTIWIVADGIGAVGGAMRIAGPLASIGYVFYLVYDLSALLTRRRLGEELGAVADLYRDLLNFLTYWSRVRSHWRRHPIWPRQGETRFSDG